MDTMEMQAVLPLLSEDERQRILYAWNATAVDYPSEICLHELIVQQMQATPDAIALVFEDEQLTYRELDRRSNFLARLLQAQGVGPEVLVGICMERSLALMIGLVGILKAGGVYVPIDPTYPADRLAYMLSDAQIAILLTQQKWLATLGTIIASVMCMDSSWYKETPENDIVPISGATASNLIYVIYTSGSTGRPKGTMNWHRGLCNRLDWMQRAYPLQNMDRVLQKTPCSFDVSAWEFFWPLLVGATLVLARPEGHKDNTYLVTLIAEQGITTLHFVPSMLQVFLEEPDIERCHSLKYVICSGEALPFSLKERFFARLQASLHNLYGPTEAAIDVTFWDCQPDTSLNIVPIGYPIANTQMYVLDPAMQPVPIGMPGELYIGGDGLARGYLNRPDLTAERFVPSPFSTQLGARLYRTGDLARYHADGSIEYLGRLDQQIKIQGVRIELGEIETLLRQHSAVQDVVILMREDRPGDKRLVAYLIAPAGGQPVAPLLLRSWLRDHLPAYMLPSAFLWLEAFPLSPNGKLERRALPAPTDFVQEDDTFQAPRTPTEELLAGIWEEVLGIARVGRLTHFFESGGHSLLVNQMLARLRRLLQIEVPAALVFEHPCLADLAAHVDQVRLGTDVVPLLPALYHQEERDASYPLSFAQQQLWFLNQLEPLSPFYNIARSYYFQGPVQVAVLAASLHTLVQRHESLRSVMVVGEEEPRLLIQSEVPVECPLSDLSGLASADEAALEAERVMRAEGALPFDLSKGPLFRFRLLRLPEQQTVLLVTLHHIIADGWSLEVLQREVEQLYRAGCHGETVALAPLEVQYHDYARWLQEWLQGEVLQRQLDYWQQHLEGSNPLLALPADHPRPPIQTFRGAVVNGEISAQVSQDLKAMGRREGVTLYMLLLAAFATLLMRYSGQEDVVIGTPVANRNEQALEGVIGLFVNTLAIRLHPWRQMSFRQLLSEVRNVMLHAHAHRDLPFEKLVQELALERAPNSNPLFQVVFVLQYQNDLNLTLGDIKGKGEDRANGTSKFDLVLELTESEAGIQVKFEYNTDLFEAVTITRLTSAFEMLLHGIVAQPDQKLALLPLLAEDDLQLLRARSSSNSIDQPQTRCIHTVFAEQAERTPDAVAVVHEDHFLTYGELNTRANQLAHHLQRYGVEADTRVGLCVQRSLAMVIGILGILKAGGAYVPIDSGYPPERLAFIFADTHLPILLTEASLREGLDFQGVTICLDTGWHTISEEPIENPECYVTPEHLAYIIYTSGTTGQPKGSMIPHRSIAGFMAGNELMRLSCPLIHLQHSSRSWDALTLELWPALLYGGCCVLYPADRSTLDGLAEVIRRYSVQTLWITASLFNTIIDTQPEMLLGVEQVLSGGEALSLAHIQRALAQLPDTHIINGYGPSECTVFATGFPLELPLDPSWTSIPIGYPVGDRQVYLVDAAMQPVPIGVAGELVIGGSSVPRGYLDQAALTADKLVPDPFSNQPGARLYRTGDLARYRIDGSIEYLGRLDQQIKIQGVRIEPGEIEALLRQHPAVQDAALLLREDRPGDKRLVAYLIASEGKEPVSTLLLRSWLHDHLPVYMLPSAFMWIEAFPLSANGKLERRALPAPNDLGQEDEQAFQAPRTPTEELLAGIWEEVLGVERVGRLMHFFEGGGHSLLVIQMLARLRRLLQIEVPVSLVFEHPRLDELAAHVDQVRLGAKDVALLPALRSLQAKEASHPLSFAQKRLWFLSQLEPLSPFYNITRAYHFQRPAQIAVLAASLHALVQRHESLRSVVIVAGGEPQFLIQPNIPVELPLSDLSGLIPAEAAAEAERVMAEESVIPFDLMEGPLFRFRLLRLHEQQTVLLVTLHHIIADGWSLEVLQREVEQLYTAGCHGETVALAPLEVQYRDYVRWAGEWLQGEVLQRQLDYWQQHLVGSNPLLTLPTDRPRPPIQTFRGGVLHEEISVQVSQQLREMSRREGVTLYMLLLAGFATLLMRYSGQEDVVIGTPVANRNEQALEGVIGLFVNTLAIRLRPWKKMSFRQLLSEVRTVMLHAHAHHDLPFEKLVEVLQPERSLSHNPLFQVAFALWSAVDQPTAGDTMLIVQEIDNGTTKQDMMLNIVNTASGLQMRWEYNRDLFDAETILRIAKHFQVLLAEVANNPDQQLALLPLLSAAEQQQMLHNGNDTSCPYPEQLCFHQLFERQAAAIPDAIAIVYEGSFLTYRQLDQRANQLAHYLRSLHIGPEVPVGIGLERSLEMVIGLLGVLKAGGMYVPLDPSYPPERLQFMLTDARVAVLLTQRPLYDRFADQKMRIICLDEQWYSEDVVYTSAPASGVLPDNTAYIIYTSGSTGKPKGVMAPHRGLCSLAQAQARAFGVHERDRVLQFASLSFDASIWEIVMAFSAGATLHLAPVTSMLPGMPLLQLLTEEAITTATLSPSVLALLPAENLPLLRTLITAGEACTAELVAHWSDGRAFYNAYGPTETTVCASVARCLQGKRPVIGTAIANMQLYVLDAYYQPVPPGVSGELYLGGVGVARGYLRRPDLTATHFVPDPFSAQPGARLYKTGDIARMYPDGNVEFIGRVDHQVKVRGFRIELGEIEAVINTHPQVRESIIVVRDEASGDQRMVAYIVTIANTTLDMGEMRAYLLERLPKYMVPFVLMPLERFPLTTNAKIDYRALPAPDVQQSREQVAYVAPEGQLEQEISAIWCELLNVPSVGMHDNFFDLGGHSLLLTRIQDRLHKKLGYTIAILDLFQHTTVRALAAALAQKDEHPDEHPNEALQVRHERATQRRENTRQQQERRRNHPAANNGERRKR